MHTFTSDERLRLVEFTDLNENPHRLDGPAVIGFAARDALSYEKWYHSGSLVQGDEPCIINYHFPSLFYSTVKVSRKIWRRDDNLYELIGYREDGTMETKFFEYDIGNMNGRGILQSSTEPFRIEYDENENPISMTFLLENGKTKRVNIEKSE